MKYIFEDSNRVWFTSDTHFGHKNILLYSQRPFETIQEHDEKIIENWNNVVKPDDWVFHLGDFALSNDEHIRDIFNRLNGHKVLIIGNHDYNNILRLQDVYSQFELVTYQATIKVGQYQVIMNHYPFLTFDGPFNTHQKIIQLFGHVHSKHNECNGYDNDRLYMLFKNQYDVGVDNNNYRPVSFTEILPHIKYEK